MNFAASTQRNMGSSVNQLERIGQSVIAQVLLLTILVALPLCLYLAPDLVAVLLTATAVGTLGLMLFWQHPELGLIVLVFLTSSIIEPDTIDLRLPIGGGLDLRDLLLIGILGLSAFQRIVRGRIELSWIPVGGPLFFFICLAAISAATALYSEGVAANWALNDLRILLYYSVFFITAWNIREHKQLRTLLVGLFLIANITAAIVIIQQFLGPDNLLLESMAGGRWQVWAQEDGTIRVVPPGHALMHFMMVLSFCLAFFNRHRPGLFLMYGLQFLFLNIGLILTFTRAGWLASGIALIIVVFALLFRYRKRASRTVAVAISSLILFSSVIGLLGQQQMIGLPNTEAVVERFGSLFTPRETLQTNSLQWRLFEYEKAVEAISAKPWTGVSLGNSYRDITVFQGESRGLWTNGDLSSDVISRYTRYIHSSYLSIATKMGLPGITIFLWFCLAFLISSWKLYRSATNPQASGIALAIFAAFLGLMQWSIFHAWFVETESTCVVGLMTGIVAAVAFLDNKSSWGTEVDV